MSRVRLLVGTRKGAFLLNADGARKDWTVTGPPAPVPDALVGHDHAALGQDQLDVPQTEAEYMIQPDRVADDLGREAMPRIGGGLWRYPVSLARFPSGHQLPLSWRCPTKASSVLVCVPARSQLS